MSVDAVAVKKNQAGPMTNLTISVALRFGGRAWRKALFAAGSHVAKIPEPLYRIAFIHYLRWTIFFFSSRRRHTRFDCDWSSDVCSSDLTTDDDPNNPYGATTKSD